MPKKVVEPVVTVEVASTRRQLRDWVKEQIAGKTEVHSPTVADAAVLHFSDDREFIVAFLNEMLRPMIYQTVVQVMKATRGAGDVIVLGDDVVTRDVATERARTMRNKWTGWLERSGTRHVRLMEMRRDDLLLAADEREKRGATEYELAALWRALAERLEGNEKVAERFSADEIERVRTSLATGKAA